VPNYSNKLGTMNMSYIRHKIIKNKKYAYEITSFWDKKLQQSRNVSRYLGPVESETNEVIKFVKKSKEQEKLILDFGDGYFLYESIKNSEFYNLTKEKIFDKLPGLFPLIIYRICTQSPMYHCENWMSGTVLSCLFENVDLSSQRISDMLACLGEESIQRSFFKEYLKLVGGSESSIIIDATSLPNQIDIDYNAWGRSDGKIEKQFKLLCVVDQFKKTPLFYRFLPGNLTDVSTLQTTILELEEMGVKNSFVLLDAGYFSEANLCDLYHRKIEFLTRMPSGRRSYKDIILNEINDLEKLENASVLGKRSFFIKKLEIDLYGNKAIAYAVLDPERKAKETKDLLQKYCGDKSEHDEVKDKIKFLSCGIMILVSSKEIPANEIVSAYYFRQSIEQIFGFSKNDLGLLPVRHHNDLSVRGYLFMQFLSLIFYIKIREKIFNISTVEQGIMTLRKLKCKVFDKKIIPSEPTKDQRALFKQLGILVPNFLGI
jgi:transposase